MSAISYIRLCISGGVDINSFAIPKIVFQKMFDDENWDVMRLYVKDEASDQLKLVSVIFSYKSGLTYAHMLVGLDYRFLHSHKTYKQSLYRAVQRGKSLGCTNIYLGFTAHREKRKVGAKGIDTVAYIQAKDHFSADFIENMSLSK